MKEKFVCLAVFALVLFSLIVVSSAPAQNQNTARPFTLVYSNNINGEIDPCPT
jgi:hypothetical protein